MKYLLIFFISSITFNISLAQNPILSFDFAGENPGQTEDWKTTFLLDEDLEILTGISKGAGITGRNGNDAYNTGSFSAQNIAEAITNQTYISLQLQSKNGKEMDLKNSVFSLNLRRSSTGPENFAILSDVNGFSSSQVIYEGGLLDDSNQSFNFNLPDDSIYNVKQDDIEIRIYAWNAASTAGNFRFNELSLAVEESSVEVSVNPDIENAKFLSSVNTEDETVFSFKVSHPGNRVGDAGVMLSDFVVQEGNKDEFPEWQTILENVKLVSVGEYVHANVQSNRLLFQNLPNQNPSDVGFLSIGQSKIYDLLVSFKDDFGPEKFTADGKKLQFLISNSDLVFDQGKVIDFQLSSDSSSNIVDVEATQMRMISNFLDEVEIGDNIHPAIEIQAEDDNGSRDLDYSNTISAAFSTTCGELLDAEENFELGLASFHDLKLNTQKVNAQLNFTSPGFNDLVGPEFDVVYSGRTTLAYYDFENDLLATEGTSENENHALTIVGPDEISLQSISGSDGQTASENCWNIDPAYWIVALNTEGYSGVQLSFEQRSSNTGPRDFQLQYKIGEMGSWDIIENYTVANEFNTAKIEKLNLPPEIDDQELVYMRWLKSSSIAVNEGPISNLGVNNIDNILFTGSAVDDITNSNFRFKPIEGNWLNACNWEIFKDGEWKNTNLAPNAEVAQITIPSNAIVKMNNGRTAYFSKITIEKGGALHLKDDAKLIYSANENAPQLEVMGELWDAPNSGSCLELNNAEWLLGDHGSFIKSSGSTSMFREQYHITIDSIPASARWIYRKIFNRNPVSAILTSNMTYPNLIFESYDGNYDNPILNSATLDLIILGDLDVGGDGSGSVHLTSRYRSAIENPLVINENLIIKNDCELSNAGGGSTLPGIGIDLKGNAIIDGVLDFTGGGDTQDTNAGKLIFSANDQLQNLSGSGNVRLYDLLINKTSQDVQLGIDLEIQNQLVLNSGALDLNGNNIFLLGEAELLESRMKGDIVYDATAVDKTKKGGYVEALNRSVDENIKDIAGLGVFLSDTESYPVDIKRFHYRVKGFDGNQGVNKVYDLEGNPSSTEMKMQLAEEELLDFEMENISLYRYDEEQSEWVLFEKGKTIDAENNFISVTGVDQFSVWSASSSESPLPVELVYFDYENQENNKYLVWETASEIRNKGFEIQSSNDGKNFEAIDFVPSSHQNGNSQSLSTYHYLIKDQKQSRFYRLKQIDLDGEFEFSHVIKNELDFELTPPTVYPNPFSAATSIYLSNYSTVESIRIYDEMGKLKNVLLNEESFLIEKFQSWGKEVSKGLYFLQINSENEENSKLVKLIKE